MLKINLQLPEFAINDAEMCVENPAPLPHTVPLHHVQHFDIDLNNRNIGIDMKMIERDADVNTSNQADKF